uniref:Phosphoglucomutaseic-like n=1 Tax=Rhizophora mucronata TaxID=61149 RepID=A0A2P2LS13_RHIMU
MDMKSFIPLIPFCFILHGAAYCTIILQRSYVITQNLSNTDLG